MLAHLAYISEKTGYCSVIKVIKAADDLFNFRIKLSGCCYMREKSGFEGLRRAERGVGEQNTSRPVFPEQAAEAPRA